MLSVKIMCCPMCGAPMASQVSGRETEHLRREGISISIAHYPRGFAGGAGYAERTRFVREVCAHCSDALMALLEPAIRFIHEKEIGR